MAFFLARGGYHFGLWAALSHGISAFLEIRIVDLRCHDVGKNERR
ncbi:hypothetical protein V6Z11_D07G256700 [Gossypium hirsutum]